MQIGNAKSPIAIHKHERLHLAHVYNVCYAI